MTNKAKSVDEWLDSVDYGYLDNYVPSEFALKFMNYIKLVNGAQGESNKTPPMHLAMIDKLASPDKYIVNLVFRGSGKTSIFGEYLFPFIAIFRSSPYLGDVDGAIYISDSMENGAKSLRKNMEHRYNNSEFLQTQLPIAKFTDNYIEFTNQKGQQFGVKLFGATTGIRGTKIFGKRPVLCVLDDLISDEASKSKTVMNAIKDTVYKGINYALDPKNRKIIFNGTPFNKEDIIIEAVESGGWSVNVYPVCEQFPCAEKDFKGAWEDRFSYSLIKEQYDLAVSTGKGAAFYQELMLRINSADERLVQDEEIRWYSRIDLLQNRGNFNFYITTDFATSAKQTADFSVISVWAYNNNGDWFWVDGICEKQTMDKNIDNLFTLVQQYKPQAVGIEVTGQQGAFIQWLQKEQMTRNIWFRFASNQSGNSAGIRPTTDKLTRFNMVVPWFKSGKFYFPKEAEKTVAIGEMLQEISLATKNGIKGHDDCIDTISQLVYMNPWKPSVEAEPVKRDNSSYGGMWDFSDIESETPYETGLDSYII